MAAEKDFVYDAAAEAMVIGAAIASRQVRRGHVRLIADSEFLVPAHPPIWRALRRLENAGMDHDPAAFRRFVSDEGGTADDGYLDALEASATVPENLEWLVATMRWDACRARLFRGAFPELLALLKDPKAQPQQVMALAVGIARAVEGGGARRGVDRNEEVFREYRAETLARQVTRNYWPMGWDVLDGPADDLGVGKLTEGTAPGLTAVCAGLVGSGKSTFSGALAIKLAKMGRRVLYCIWEMRRIAMLDVMCASVTGLELDRIVQGRLDDEEVRRKLQAAAWITRRIKFMRNVFFDKDTDRGDDRRRRWQVDQNERNLDVIEGYVAESGCDVVIYDLFERALVDTAPQSQMRAMTRMQELHKSFGVYGLLMHQINLKDVESREDKRPTRADIKGSSGFVEAADQIFVLHREAQFKAVPDDSLELINYKQRMGKANWCVRFDWDGPTCRVGDGVEVPFDPSADDAAADLGDVGGIRTKSGSRRRGRQRMGDRDR